MYQKTEEGWDALWQRLSLDRGIPQPASVSNESGEQLQEMIRRIDAGHAEMRRQFEAYKPEILIIIGGDQVEEFDRSNVPQFMIYLGEHAKGNKPGGPLGDPEPPQVEMEVDVEFSKWLLTKLVKEEDFDISFSSALVNLPGRRKGLPHAFVNPTSVLFEEVQTKVCLIFENTYDPPSLSAKRCYDLGQAIARLVKDDPRRIAILGSGGLAHHPGGKRSGWLDVPLDTWFLEQLAAGNGQATKAMYTFDSDTMVGGTGEVRAWITVAGAMEEVGSRATVLDYVEGAKTVTGLGMAYWPTEESAVAAR
jgi:protocatechuate 4,5-dioxygenase beta chain